VESTWMILDDHFVVTSISSSFMVQANTGCNNGY